MGSVRPGVPTLTDRPARHGGRDRRGADARRAEAQRPVRRRRAGRAAGADPRARRRLHDDNGDVAVAGLRREEWTGASYSDEEFRSLAEVLAGMPFIGTGGLGERIWSGPALTVTGVDALPVDARVNAVVPFARAKISARIHPEQDPLEAQAALVRHLERSGRSGSRSWSTPPRPAGLRGEDAGPAYEAAREALARAWGGETQLIATGGSIPLVNALQQAAPEPRCCCSGPPTASRTSTRRTSASSSTSSRRPSSPRPSSSVSTRRAFDGRSGSDDRPEALPAKPPMMSASSARSSAAATRCRTRRSCSSGCAWS